MDEKEIKEIDKNLDVIREAIDNLSQVNFEAMADIRSRLDYINLIMTKK